ncbi:MAG: radical SAM protein [Bacteroidia bacterium]|nr:radical SAM protein [Bacteroidia bacterium]
MTIAARERQTANPGKIPVMEHYYTLQGEGAWTGTAAHFIRLAGCDVGCVWCDVKESWEIGEDQWMDLEAIADLPVESGADRVVLTGGEPAMYDLTALTAALRKRGMKIHIETSGAYPFSGDFDWITLSPKKFKPALEEYYSIAHELKVIVFNKHDLQWAGEHAAKMDSSKTIFYLQAEWSKKDQVTPAILDFVKANPQWRLSMQTHKYIDIP